MTQSVDQHDEMSDLIERSSLGAPDVKAIRATVPPVLTRAMRLGSQYHRRAEVAEAECRRLQRVLGRIMEDASGYDPAMSESAVVRARAGIHDDLLVVRREVVERLDRDLPIPRQSVVDLIHLLDALDDLDALP